MPRKLRELKAALKKAGFVSKKGKGSHTIMDASAKKKKLGAIGKRRGGRQALSGKGSRGSDRGCRITRLIPHYSMVIQWSDEDEAFIVSLPEFGGCKTHGATYEEAAKNGREVLELLVRSCLEEGEPLPDIEKHSVSA